MGSFKYREILLPEGTDITNFQSNSRILRSIRKLENQIEQRTEHFPKLSSIQMTKLFQICAAVNENQKSTSRACTKCNAKLDANFERTFEEKHSYFNTLGPLLCKVCAVSLKNKHLEDETKHILMQHAITKIDRENTVMNILNHSFHKVTPLNNAHHSPKVVAGYMTRNNTPVHVHKIESLRHSKKQINHIDLRKKLKKLSVLKEEIQENQSNNFSTIVKGKGNLKKSRNIGKHTKNKASPDNTPINISPDLSDVDEESLIKKEIHVRLPRTDLEWFEEISAARKPKSIKPKDHYLDPLLLAEKLSALFLQRNLPPPAPLERIRLDSIGSISTDLDGIEENSSCSSSRPDSAKDSLYKAHHGITSLYGNTRYSQEYGNMETRSSSQSSLRNIDKGQHDLYPFSPPLIDLIAHRKLNTPAKLY